MKKMPVPGEIWVHKEFTDSDGELIPSPVYVTGIDVDSGLVFGVLTDMFGNIPGGASSSWHVNVFTAQLEKAAIVRSEEAQ
jgi:hypothetical protein